MSSGDSAIACGSLPISMSNFFLRDMSMASMTVMPPDFLLAMKIFCFCFVMAMSIGTSPVFALPLAVRVKKLTLSMKSSVVDVTKMYLPSGLAVMPVGRVLTFTRTLACLPVMLT